MKLKGSYFGRVLHQQIDEDWLLTQDTFPGWGSYTGTFTVTDLEGKVFYEVNVDNGSSASEGSTNGRAYCNSEVTQTQEVCTGEYGQYCFPTYEWITSCEWFWAGGNYVGSGGSSSTPGSSGTGAGGNTVGGVGVYNPKFADEDISDLVAEIEANKANDWEDKID